MTQPDFLDELGELALGSRLKRLSERLMTDGQQVYRHCGHQVQPKWFTLLALLHRRGEVSVVDAAELLGLSQPAVSQFVNQLLKQGLINVKPAPQDARRKCLSLSDEGRRQIEQMQPMWQAVDLAAKQLCSEAGAQFYQALRRFEQALSRRSLLERTLAIMDNPTVNPEVNIVSYSPELAEHFYTINAQWIEAMFILEPADKAMLQDPQKEIIDQGGQIYFALHPTLGVIGTCALLYKRPGCFELTKMGVLDHARGLKVGETMLAYVIKQAQAMHIDYLFLLTNSRCEAAIHLYRKFGFVDDAQTMSEFAAKYERCNVAMRHRKSVTEG